MASPSVVIDIATEFTGKKAFDQAGKSTSSLEKGVKNLGKAFVGVFATQKVLAFGKASAKAFMEDEKAAVKLTTAVKNLGLGFEDARIKNFVSTLEAQSAVLDDKLRPALQALLTTTGSVAKSQELLKLAIDVAAGSGVDLTTVANDLAQAYVGNSRGLRKYSLGLTQAELKSSKFSDIQTKLNKQFSGSNAAYLQTYAGQLDAINVAYANMQETIGSSLLDSFALLAGDQGIAGATNAMEAFGKKSGEVIYGIAAALGKLNVSTTSEQTGKSRSLFYDLYLAFGGSVIETIANFGKSEKAKNTPLFFPGSGVGNADYIKNEKARKAAEAAAAKRAKELAALQIKTSKAKIEADKKAAANKALLSKAESIFDMDKIQIEAALKGKITDEETLRLQLQRAILNEDFTLAEKLQKQLEASQRATVALQGQLSAIKPAANPFEEWIKSLEDISTSLTKILGTSLTLDPGRKGGGILALEPDDLLVTAPKAIPTPTPTITDPVPVVVIPSPTPVPATNGSMAGLGGGGPFYGQELPWYMKTSTPPPVTVNVNVEGSVISQNEMTQIVADALIIADTEGLTTRRPGAIGFRPD
jgi:hypothetical protein